MKFYRYIYPCKELPDETVVRIVSEATILEEYWEYFSTEMKKRSLTPTREDCIDDFCIINWAVEVTELEG